MRIVLTCLFIIGLISNSLSQVSDISHSAIEIKREGKTEIVKLSRYDFSLDNLVKAFGKYDKKETGDEVVANGIVSFLRYDKSYFVCPEEKNANLGFRISTDDFIVILSDTTKLQVGKSVEDLLSIVDVEKTVRYGDSSPSRFGIDYIGNVVLKIFFIANGKKMFADALLGIAFDPNTLNIIEMSFSYSS